MLSCHHHDHRPAGIYCRFSHHHQLFAQVIRTLRTGDTRSISFTMYLMLVAGVATWLAYGLLLGALPIVLANGITLVLSSIILAMKWRDIRTQQHTA